MSANDIGKDKNNLLTRVLLTEPKLLNRSKKRPIIFGCGVAQNHTSRDSGPFYSVTNTFVPLNVHRHII